MTQITLDEKLDETCIVIQKCLEEFQITELDYNEFARTLFARLLENGLMVVSTPCWTEEEIAEAKRIGSEFFEFFEAAEKRKFK